MSGLIGQSILLVAALLLAGCARQDGGPNGVEASPEIRPPYVEYYIPGAGSIFDFHLTDGTRCVAHRWDGGITCDWSQP